MTIVTAAARVTDLGDETNNPFVAHNNLGASATLGGTSVLTGGDRANAVTGSTYDKWRPDVTGANAYLTFDFGSAITISFAAIAAHNLFDFAGNVRVQNSADAVTWADAGAGLVTPANNTPIGWRMVKTGNAFRYWRFAFGGLTAGDLLSVGVAFMGGDLVIPRRLYQGFAPILTPTEVQLQSNVSVGNELLGSSVVGRGSTLMADISNVGPSFIRSANWLAFQRHFNDGGGAFFAWRPAKYPEDIHYIWRNGPVIRPENTGPRDLMNIHIEAQAHNA